VDIRVIAATNRDLGTAVKAGSFRADLLYRFNVFPIDLPPLRNRSSDIPLFVRAFVQRFSKKFGKRLDQIPQQTMDRLMHYTWPGNVRELENVIERAAILSPGPLLQIDEGLLPSNQVSDPVASGTLEDVERAHITRVLQEVDWVVEGKQGASTRLGLHPNTLRSRMQKLGIKKPRPSF
jgi:transcriptional regulator with GAF, ATPase, and Fis domain